MKERDDSPVTDALLRAETRKGLLILYFDASALVKLLIVERGSNEARQLWNTGSPVVTSWITFAEACAAVGPGSSRASALGRQGIVSLRSLEIEWAAVFALDTDAVTARLAGSLAVRHGLRGMDAIHLASALRVATGGPVVVTLGRRPSQSGRRRRTCGRDLRVTARQQP